MIHPWQRQAPPCSTHFLSWHACSSHSRFHVDAHCSQLLLQLPACPSSAWGRSHSPSVMPATVTPSSPIASTTPGKNVPTTCLPASRSLMAVAEIIWVSGILLPPSKHASSLAMNSGTSLGHSWWSTQSTATTLALPGDHRAKSRPRCQSTSGSLDWIQANTKTKS